MLRRVRVFTPLLVAGTIALLAGILVVLTSARPAQSTEPPARCVRLAQESVGRAQVVTGTGPRVAVIGDSYSAGSGLSDPLAAWTAELPGELHVYGFPGSGFSPRASECPGAGYDARAPAAMRSDPRLVVVEGGLNDFNQPAAAIRAGFRRLLAVIGNRQVLVVGPASAPSRAAGARRADRVLRAIARQTSTPYLSMLGDRFTYLPDRLHLTLAGHRAFGAIVADRLRRG